MLFELPLAYDVVEHSLLEKLSLFPSHHFFLFFSSFSSYQPCEDALSTILLVHS